MLTHSSRLCPVIETALGDCTVFFESCIMWMTLSIPAPEKTDITIHWPNADVMLRHRLRRRAGTIPTKSLKTTNIMLNMFFSEHLLKTKVLKGPETLYCTNS